MSSMAPVKTFGFDYEAEMAKGVLLKEGIEAVVQRDKAIIEPGLFQKITLFVKQEDLEKARLILGALEQTDEDGILRRYYPDGSIYLEIGYKDGVRDGYAKEYYENGKLKGQCHYVKGIREGGFQQFYENGHLEVECFFREDKLDGAYRTYHRSGQLASVANFVDDVADGEIQSYYENGDLQSQGFMLKGVEEGVIRTHSPDGIFQEDFYKNGRLQWSKVYNADGIVRMETNHQARRDFFKIEGFVLAVVSIIAVFNWFGEGLARVFSMAATYWCFAQIPMALIVIFYLKVVKPVLARAASKGKRKKAV